jgi:hypothetical protein
MNCRTNCCKTFLFVLVLLALAIQAAPAFAAGICSTQGTGAGNCLQNESCAAGVTQKLNCTANDVRVAKVINTRQPNGDPINSCIAGQTGINFVADFLVQTSSTSSRSNIGLYFSKFDVTQQATALTGSCSDNVISPPHHTGAVSACLGSGAYNDPTCTGFGTYDELDPTEPKSTTGTTGCGDTTSQDGTVCLTANDNLGNAAAVPCSSNLAAQTFTSTQVVTVEITNFTCPNVAAGTQVQLPNCTSWQIPGGTIACTTGPVDYPYPTSPPTAIPGTPSKCNCGVVSLPIIVQTPSIVVQKACEPGASANDPNPPTFDWSTTPSTQSPTTCNAGQEGATQVTYTVAMTNNSNTGGITIDQICDDKYGTIYRSGSAPQSLAACPAGSLTIDSSTNTCTGPYDLPVSTVHTTPGATCQFKATPGVENLGLGATPGITDTITAFGHGDISNTSISGTSNPVTVNSSDAPSSAKTSPGPATATNICATVRYTATVQNTSAADEKIFISGLADNSTDLTTTSTNIVGTTCGIANGLGTLANTAGDPFPQAGLAAGTTPLPPPTSDGGAYHCTFDVLFCGAPTAGAEQFGTGTCGANGFCSAGQGGTVACTTDAQCDTTCTGISHSDQLTATLTGDETSPPLDTISPVVNKTTHVTECVTTSQVTQ